ncbi:MAG TPA: hypothetical protein VFW14_11595 [Gaiellales bacterium]|nr:hypothetical protein [Gaiellales bacterium]
MPRVITPGASDPGAEPAPGSPVSPARRLPPCERESTTSSAKPAAA